MPTSSRWASTSAGSWVADECLTETRVAEGRLAGFAAGAWPNGDVGLRSWVSTIEPGAVGCLALSP